MKILASGLQFPEGPVAMPDGSIILVEIARETLSRITPNGRVEVVAKRTQFLTKTLRRVHQPLSYDIDRPSE